MKLKGAMMKILISGSSGFIGSKLKSYLENHGHVVVSLVRGSSKKSAHTISWDIEKGTLDIKALEGFDAIINLSGENIADGRWTEEKKRRIRDSRVKGTMLLSEAIAELQNPPKTFLCASAVGYYGDRDDSVLTEKSSKGTGFLSDVCAEWEEAAKKAKDSGVRVVNLRFGLVLDSEGGALKTMLIPFKLGLGGIVGSGQQYESWVSLNDVVRSVEFLLNQQSIVGPVNVVAPQAVTNEEFTKTLGRVLNRLTIFWMPAWFAKLVFGEMADDALLTSTRVVPKVLMDAGFVFSNSDLESTLRKLLND